MGIKLLFIYPNSFGMKCLPSFTLVNTGFNNWKK